MRIALVLLDHRLLVAGPGRLEQRAADDSGHVMSSRTMKSTRPDRGRTSDGMTTGWGGKGRVAWAGSPDSGGVRYSIRPSGATRPTRRRAPGSVVVSPVHSTPQAARWAP
jgi:hypothetical protein